MKIVEELILNLSKKERQSHMDLSEPCIERGGNSTNHKGVLAQYLNTNIPYGVKFPLCHGCHNGKCSNPKHLYWGTPKENVQDSIINGTQHKISPKIGPMDDSIKIKISKTLNGRPSNNPIGINGYIRQTQTIKWDVEWLLEQKSNNVSNKKIRSNRIHY